MEDDEDEDEEGGGGEERGRRGKEDNDETRRTVFMRECFCLRRASTRSQSATLLTSLAFAYASRMRKPCNLPYCYGRIERFRIGESSRGAAMREQNRKRQDLRCELGAILTRYLAPPRFVVISTCVLGRASKSFAIARFVVSQK
jgi:hypothetical protein